MDTRRKRTRIAGKFDADLIIGDRDVPVRTENLSLNGCKVTAETGLEDFIDEACRLEMELADDVRLSIEAEIVRARGPVAALEFTSMDEDSYAHLRNIVRLSAEDADAIDREQATPAFDDDPD